MTTPDPQAPPPKPPRGPSGASSLVGLLLGLFLCLALPPLVFGVSLGVLSGSGLNAGWEVLIPLFLALVIPIGVFLFLNSKLKRSPNPDAADFRKTLRDAGFASLAIWAVISLVVGLCIAILAGAY